MSLYQSRFGGTRIADFNRAVFRSEAWIGDVTFAEDAFFSEATFGADAPFYEVTFERSGYFDRASFERAQNIGLLQGGSVSFAGATFNRSVHLAVSTDRLDCVGTQFRGGANLDVGRAEVVLDGAEFDRTSVLVALPSQGGGVDPLRRPRLLSLRGADVGELRLVDVDLRACRFFRAQNLDGLRLEGDCEFASTPVGWTFRRPLPLRRRWIARQTIAEEHEWRYRRQRRTQLEPSPDEGAEPGDDWYPPACRPAPWLSEVAPQLKALEPGELASIYRSLRKGREDNKDEPGAADFYYGEMEMRRRPPGSGKSIFERRSASKAERVLIWLYWLVSGYGLRASRALAALVVTVLVFAFLLHEWGFEGPESFGEALLFSTESTTSIFRGRERELTGSGEVLALALRLLGPVFFGLMVLSLRGRVRR
jgi:hypothetical protein